MREGELDSVLQATAFGFIYIHPFQAGNGRLDRCLIAVLNDTADLYRDFPLLDVKMMQNSCLVPPTLGRLALGLIAHPLE